MRCRSISTPTPPPLQKKNKKYKPLSRWGTGVWTLCFQSRFVPVPAPFLVVSASLFYFFSKISHIIEKFFLVPLILWTIANLLFSHLPTLLLPLVQVSRVPTSTRPKQNTCRPLSKLFTGVLSFNFCGIFYSTFVPSSGFDPVDFGKA